MEQRCDQVLDCTDKSDEVNCKLIRFEESYRKSAPPVSSLTEKNRQIIPVSIKVSFFLSDIPSIRETDNEIDVKLALTLEWFETRATYHNLKTSDLQNTLEQDDISQMWIPKLIYKNNKNNFHTRLALSESTIFVHREGHFTRSSLIDIDEIEIFQGRENPVKLIQSYTKDFRCQFQLRHFPFDIQVRLKHFFT